jgi:hypothetical protein
VPAAVAIAAAVAAALLALHSRDSDPPVVRPAPVVPSRARPDVRPRAAAVPETQRRRCREEAQAIAAVTAAAERSWHLGSVAAGSLRVTVTLPALRHASPPLAPRALPVPALTGVSPSA